MKFSYQQLPVSLKLIYTILQVLSADSAWGPRWRLSVAASQVIFVFRKCQSLRSQTFCSTWWTVWRSSVSMENACILPAKIIPSSWPTFRKRCSFPGASVFSTIVQYNLSASLFTAEHVSLSSSLWSMLKSEFCQLASLAVPQLLHALSLSHGADIFWNLINSNFNNKDWKIRFEAGQRLETHVCNNSELIL